LPKKQWNNYQKNNFLIAVNEDTKFNCQYHKAYVWQHDFKMDRLPYKRMVKNLGEKEMLNLNRLQHLKQYLLEIWNKGWKCFFDTINSLQPEQLSQIIYIRNEGQTALDAINRQLAHYPYHIGQIVFYAKMLKKGDWDSLSIPKNKSNDYNSDKFSKDKSVKHFTDDELEKLQ